MTSYKDDLKVPGGLLQTHWLNSIDCDSGERWSVVFGFSDTDTGATLKCIKNAIAHETNPRTQRALAFLHENPPQSMAFWTEDGVTGETQWHAVLWYNFIADKEEV